MEYINREKLKILMIKKGISVKELSNDLGVSYQALYKKMRRGSNFNETEICFLKKKFGKDIFSC